jgi:hypothetical protein
MVEAYNESLAADAWELVEGSRVAGRPVFEAQRLLIGSEIAVEALEAVAEAAGST